MITGVHIFMGLRGRATRFRFHGSRDTDSKSELQLLLWENQYTITHNERGTVYTNVVFMHLCFKYQNSNKIATAMSDTWR